MTLIERLTQYNAWRRGEDESLQQPHPTQIGKDIDEAIAKLAAAERLAEAALELVGWVAIYRINPDDTSNRKGMIAWAKQTSEALTYYQSKTRKEQDDE